MVGDEEPSFDLEPKGRSAFQSTVRSRGKSVRDSKPSSLPTTESPTLVPKSPATVIPPSTANDMPGAIRVVSPCLSWGSSRKEYPKARPVR